MKRAILLVAFAALCGAQTTVNGGRDYKGTLKASGSVSAVDFSGAGSTAPAKAGSSASRPTACTQGQIHFATDVAAGQHLYFCTVTGAPGVWTLMSGSAAGSMTAGAGAPAGSCAPPMLYIDTTNQDLWYCGASNSWRKPTADTSGFATAAGANTWTGYNNFSGGQWRPPESTVANLPSAGGNAGKVFMVTDAVTAGSCTSGGGSLRELCRANGSAYECVGGCGSGGGGGGSGAYISSLMTGPDSTRTSAGAAHGFATTALLVGVYDNASPRNAISVGWSVNASTYDVAITFASPQSNYYVVINGGVGPQGATGATGAAGAAGATGATGAGYLATSTTSLAIGTGSTAFTTQAGLAYSAGARARASSTADGGNYMEGLVTAYSGTTLTINVTATGGSGSHADWNINLVGQPGTNGAGSGTVTSVAFSGGLVTVTNPSAAASMTVAGTSGGIPYFSSASTWASSGALAANGVVLGGGAGSAPAVTSADSTATHALFATAGAPAFRALATGDLPTVGVANGGTGTASTLTGLVRGSASAMTAAELSGDVTTSGSNAVTLDANYRTRTVSVTDLAPVVGDSGLILVVNPATAIHLTRIFCAVQGTTNVVVNLDKRAEATIGTDSAAHLLGADLTAVSGGANASTWSATPCGGTSSCAVAAHAPVVMTFTSVSGTPTALNCSVNFTVDQ